METKLTASNWFGFLTDLSFTELGNAFNYTRHSIRHWFLARDNLLRRLQIRNRKRKERLDHMMINTNHVEEIKKLYILSKPDKSLNVLDSFLTYGTLLPCSRNSDKNVVINTRPPKKIKSPLMRGFMNKKKDIELGFSQNFKSLFEELYRQEYEVLYLIDERYALLIDQNVVSENHEKIIIQSQISELRSHLSQSIEKLMALHHMMVHPVC